MSGSKKITDSYVDMNTADQKGTDLNNTILHIRYILFSFRKPEREDLRAQINK
jgi:hypothetical protein